LTDFQTLLKQSILARGIRDPRQREAVYAQARTAFIRQLAGQQPDLSQAEIVARVDEFDRTIKAIEAELAAEVAAGNDRAPQGADRAVADAPPLEDAYDQPAEVEREASGWDVRDGAAEVDDPAEPLQPERRRPVPYSWPPNAASRGAVVRRVATPAAWLEQRDDELPPPVPPPKHWKDEDAVYREEPLPAATRSGLPPPQRRLGWTLSEADKVRVLIGAIAVLALVLVGLVTYLLLPTRDGGVTLPINRGQVSDAAAADRIASAQLDVKQSFVLFDGRDPTVFLASPDNPVRLDGDSGGAFARIGTSTASSGVRVQIGPGLAARLAGQNIRVVMTARSSPDRGALNMRFAYQSGVALSHWQTANLARDFASSGMTWLVPQMRTSPTGADFLIIEPGIPGDGTYADIQSIRIDVLGSAPTT
jgi:hypothetical protein